MLRVPASSAVPDVSLHLLPFTVVPQHDAASQPARVSSYFRPRPDAGADPAHPTWSASFRGRELRGAQVTLPADSVGLVVSVTPPAKRARVSRHDSGDAMGEDADEDEDDALQREVQDANLVRVGLVEGRFQHFMAWEWDFAPLDSDPVFEWMRWPAFAAHIHSPVPADLVTARTETMPDAANK